MNFNNHKNGKKLGFRERFDFYPILGYHKIRTRTNFENTKAKA